MMKYTVKPGDSLATIAARLMGSASKYAELAAFNNISNPDLIHPGEQLQIPEPTPARAAPELTANLLAAAMPDASRQNIERYLAPLQHCISRYQLSTPLRLAHFLAQIGHESGALRYNEENLNYSAKALRAVFSRYFTTDAAADEYARHPQRIACRVYANRMGNGDEQCGDGWRYRGRGLIQLTGKDNYNAFGQYLNIDLLASPEQVAEPELAVGAAGWYWQKHDLNTLADADDIIAITRRINGGENGLDDRKARLETARIALNC